MKNIKTYIKKLLIGDNFVSLTCKRINGGYTSHAFILNFERSNIFIETNIRIRTSTKVLLNFNDLWINEFREEIPDHSFNKMTNIEGSFLFHELNIVNLRCKGISVKNVMLKPYGDLIIKLNNSVIIEIINDTHLEDAVIFNITDLISSKELSFFVENTFPKVIS